MKLSFRRMISGAAVLAIAGGVLGATASMASAATTPPWEPDPADTLGTLTFYNAAGQVITGGSSLTQLFAFAQASTTDPFAGGKAFIQFSQPTPGSPEGNWPISTPSVATTFPVTTPASLAGSANPVFTASSTDVNLQPFINQTTPQTATGYANVFQIRLTTSGGTGGGTNANTLQYWDADIVVNTSTGTWTQEYPAVVTPTTTTLAANPTTGTVGVGETLTATETPATAGSVAFKDGTTTIATVAVNGSGVVTTPFTPAAADEPTANLSAVFTPTDTADFGGSTGNLALTVNPQSTKTTTALAVTDDGTAGDDVSMTATLTPTAAAGTVSFFDNGSATPLNATPVTVAGGTATFDIPAGLAAGPHSIVADFTPANPANFEASQSAAQPFVLQAKQVGACAQTGSQCTDTQTIEATVPVGTLVINSPYTASNPLNLGNLTLTVGAQSGYSANAPFNGITVVDTRAGDLPWTVSALASNLSDGGTNPGSTICSQNVGLTAVTSTPGTGFTGTVTTSSNPAASPAIAPACAGTQGLGGTAAHTVATATAGLGTDVLNGTLTLNAPVSTEPGLFTGTITFTVG